MIVAFDLRYASDSFAGIGTYAYALLDELLALPGDERYVLLWNPALANRRHDFARLRAHPRVTWVERPYPTIDPLGQARVGAWLRGLRPDVYFTPYSLRPIGSGVPEVVTVHDVEALRSRRMGWREGIYRASLWHAFRARRVVTVSEFSRSEILALTGARPERIVAILPGVLPWAAGLEPRRPARLAGERFALLVGDNRTRKNTVVAARAWAALGPGPPLLLVGAGPVTAGLPTLEDMAAAAGARGVLHLGFVDPAELAWLYAHAELLLIPSLYEGFGSPLVEGMAHGLPVLASDIPVFREVGQAGALYLDPHDPAAWTRAVERLAADPAAREAMRAPARARAAQLTYHRTAEGVLAVIREAARPKR